jgi:hypothetical protein
MISSTSNPFSPFQDRDYIDKQEEHRNQELANDETSIKLSKTDTPKI